MMDVAYLLYAKFIKNLFVVFKRCLTFGTGRCNNFYHGCFLSGQPDECFQYLAGMTAFLYFLFCLAVLIFMPTYHQQYPVRHRTGIFLICIHGFITNGFVL